MSQFTMEAGITCIPMSKGRRAMGREQKSQTLKS